MRRCQVEMEKCTREHDALNSKIEELELYDDSSQRELKRKRLTSTFGPLNRSFWSIRLDMLHFRWLNLALTRYEFHGSFLSRQFRIKLSKMKGKNLTVTLQAK